MAQHNLQNWLVNLFHTEYYITLHTRYSRDHSRMFNAAKVKKCLFYGFFIALIYQLIELYFYPDEYLKRKEKSIMKDVYDKISPILDDPGTLQRNGIKTLKTMQEQASKGKWKGSEGLVDGIMPTLNSTSSYEWIEIFYGFLYILYGFLVKYILATFCLYLALYVIPELCSILYTVFVRHVIRRNGNRGINGIFRFRRARPRH